MSCVDCLCVFVSVSTRIIHCEDTIHHWLDLERWQVRQNRLNHICRLRTEQVVTALNEDADGEQG